MAWSHRFLSALAQGRAPDRFLVESFALRTGQRQGWAVGSHASLGAPPLLLAEGLEVSGGEVDTQGWGSTFTTFSFAVSALPQANSLPAIRRGDLVQIRAGFAGWTAAELEPIARGQVYEVSRQRSGVYLVRCRDLVSALSGFGTGWPDLGTPNTLASHYEAGHTSMTLGSTDVFEREGTNDGLILVTPTSGTPFYRRWSAKTATVLTIEADDPVLATDDANANSGSTAAPCLLIDATHPISATIKILLSTGAGTAGPSDTLPASWGLGLSRALVDEADAALWTGRTTQDGYGAEGWIMYADARQTSALAWLQPILASGGFFLTQRQGALTVRAGIDPRALRREEGVDFVSPPLAYAATITDDDLLGDELAHDLWSPEHPTQYGEIDVEYEDGTGLSPSVIVERPSAPDTQPAEEAVSLALGLYASPGGGDTALEVAIRLRNFYLEIPERLTLTCRGLRLAGLAPGDPVVVRSRELLGRDPAGYVGGVAGLVVSISPLWLQARVRLVVLVWPGALPAVII